MNNTEKAMMAALAYADLFKQALSTKALIRLAVGGQVEFEQVKSLSSELIVRQGNWWCLKGSESSFEEVETQQDLTQKKMRVLKRWMWVFWLCPWVKLVAVTGSVAGGNPKEVDDIDILVIAATGRLWLTRLWVSGVLDLFGKRRQPDDDPSRVNDKLCLNMWLSADHLVSDFKDIYVANELARMVSVLDRSETHEKYLRANAWTSELLPGFEHKTVDGRRETLEKYGWKWVDGLDKRLEQWQRGRMRAITKETVTSDELLLHPADYRSQILRRYAKRLKQLGFSDSEVKALVK